MALNHRVSPTTRYQASKRHHDVDIVVQPLHEPRKQSQVANQADIQFRHRPPTYRDSINIMTHHILLLNARRGRSGWDGFL